MARVADELEAHRSGYICLIGVHGIIEAHRDPTLAQIYARAVLTFGVGAAFDFHTGRIKDSPPWVKRSGLQWLHRVIQDPRRQLSRFFAQ